jgi:hypothetical protein
MKGDFVKENLAENGAFSDAKWLVLVANLPSFAPDAAQNYRYRCQSVYRNLLCRNNRTGACAIPAQAPG